MSFRGINTTVIQIRRQVFTEVARMAYANVKGEKANHLMRKIPYTIIPGEEGKLRKDIFLERAIVEERVRLAMGLPTRRMDEHNSVVSGLEDASIADKYYDPPLVNVIKFACNRCPEKLVKVSDLCQGCLAHPCMEVCPKKAITWESGRSTIDQEKCIKCGRCATVCPYNAIVKTERPCAAACGMGAIHSDELGRAEIDYSKCVSCGQCLVNCPFGAIVDKGQIFQVIQSILKGDRVIAIVAPAFIGQFSGKVSPGKFVTAMKQLGFDRVMEVAIGADLCTIEEAKDFLEKVPEKQDYMATSCCPAWVKFVENEYPEFKENISTCRSPQQMFGAVTKSYYAEKLGVDPEKIFCVSIMPCIAKKDECTWDGGKDVDAVLTTREVERMFKAFFIKPEELGEDEFDDPLGSGTGAGVIFGATGGVMEAALRSAYFLVTGKNPEADAFQSVRGLDGWKEAKFNLAGTDIRVAVASGLGNARRLMNAIRNKEVHYDFVEIMSCPGGCINGGGQPYKEDASDVEARKNVLYGLDRHNSIRFSHENPSVQACYKEYFEKPLSHRAHELLHVEE